MNEQYFAVLINGEPRSTNAGGGIRTYKTRERAIKENIRFKKYMSKKIEVVEVIFKDAEELLNDTKTN
jgi:hypothetical protein